MRNALALLFAPLLLISSMAFAGDAVIVVIDGKLVKADKVVSPKVTLVGAEQPVKPGEIVILEAKVEDEYPTYVKKQEFQWNVTENGYVKRIWSQGSQVMFGAGVNPTKFVVELKASFVYSVGSEDVVVVKQEKTEVQVGTPTPTPPGPTPPGPTPPGPTPPPTPPGPTPPPTPPGPTPPPTPSLTGVAKFAYDTALAKGPADVKKSASVLAKGFGDVAAQIGHNPEYNDPRNLLVKTKELNNTYLAQGGFDPNAWNPWSTALQEHLYAEYQGGKLKTIEDYKKFWEDIAKGLNAVQ